MVDYKCMNILTIGLVKVLGMNNLFLLILFVYQKYKYASKMIIKVI